MPVQWNQSFENPLGQNPAIIFTRSNMPRHRNGGQRQLDMLFEALSSEIALMFKTVQIGSNDGLCDVCFELVPNSGFVLSCINPFYSMGVSVGVDNAVGDKIIFTLLDRQDVARFLSVLGISRIQIGVAFTTLGIPLENFSLQPTASLPIEDLTPAPGNTQPAHENAMEPLSAVHAALFEKLQRKYELIIRQRGGVEGTLDKFKTHLASLYNNEPVHYNLNGHDITLPLNWNELNPILSTCTSSQKSEILKLYYESTIHTAYRYFLTPNPWIAADSQWALGERVTGAPRWADYERYIKYIAHLWIAASDPTEAQEGKMSIPDRQRFFILHIALINRGHNMDGSGDRDDLRGDDPSCHMGVLNRLFEGLTEHSLIQIPIADVIKIYATAFYQKFYKNIFFELSNEEFEACKNKISAGEFVDVLNQKPDENEISIYLTQSRAQLLRMHQGRDFVRDGVEGIAEKLRSHDIAMDGDIAELHFYKSFVEHSLEGVLNEEISRRAAVAQRPQSSRGPSVRR